MWKLRIPTWQEIAPLVEPSFNTGWQYDNFATDGRIATLSVDGTTHERKELYLYKIQSHVDLIPKSSPYHEARDIGSFLLKQLLH